MWERLPDDHRYDRNWTGNDARAARDYFDRVRLDESPLVLRLSWRRDRHTPSRLVGVFRLDLHALLRDGYVYVPDNHPKEVVLRFLHTPSDEIQIVRNQRSPALTIGKVVV
jgi:hypothetical protein